MPRKARKDTGIPAEEFEKAFGDGFWELPIEERFEMVIKKMMFIPVEKVTIEDAHRRRQGKEIHN